RPTRLGSRLDLVKPARKERGRHPIALDRAPCAMRARGVDILGARRLRGTQGTRDDAKGAVMNGGRRRNRGSERGAQPMVARLVCDPRFEIDSVQSGPQRRGKLDLQRGLARRAAAPIRVQRFRNLVHKLDGKPLSRTAGLASAHYDRCRLRDWRVARDGIEVVLVAAIPVVLEPQLEERIASEILDSKAARGRRDAIVVVAYRIVFPARIQLR